MNMRKNILWIHRIAGAFFAFIPLSCEKVIDIDLNKLNPKIVIEANMSDYRGDCRVAVSQTINFSDSSRFSGLGNAKVSIQSGSAAPVILEQISLGIYGSDTMRARPGQVYTLMVEADGKTFHSTVTTPQIVPFDSLYIADFNAFSNTRKFANVIFQDPPGKGNAYKFRLFKNGLENSNTFILNDDYSDGRTVNTFLAFFDNSDNQRLDPGDTVTVEMQGIDMSVYKFFQSLNQSSTGGGESVAPGNPTGNIDGGAIGYFNPFVRQRKTVIVR